MDFVNTEEQVALRDSIRRFVEREYDWDKRMTAIRSTSGVIDDFWVRMAELGWLGAGLFEEQGGFGGGAVENCLIAEEFGAALLTEPFIAHVMATRILAGLDGEWPSSCIEKMVEGGLRLAPAIQELQGRGDWSVITTTAREHDGQFLLTGAKSLVEGAGKMDGFLVSATVDRQIGIFHVEARSLGLSLHPYRTTDNRRVADLNLADAPAQCLASGSKAAAAVASGVEHGLLYLCGEALGAMNAALTATRDYLKVRRQFGMPIGNFQALQHRMADMLIETEMARSVLLGALGHCEDDDANVRMRWVAAAKVVAAKAGLFVGGQAIQLHGGIGVTEELKISHYYRRLHAISRQLGDSDFHLARFASATDSTDPSATS